MKKYQTLIILLIFLVGVMPVGAGDLPWDPHHKSLLNPKVMPVGATNLQPKNPTTITNFDMVFVKPGVLGYRTIGHLEELHTTAHSHVSMNPKVTCKNVIKDIVYTLAVSHFFI